MGPALAAFLRALDPGLVLSSLETTLFRNYPYASYPFQILNALSVPGRFELFLEVIEGQV